MSSWNSRQGTIAPGYAELDGAGADLVVTVLRASISILDSDNYDETPFVHALKERIEERMKRRLGLTHLEFDRQRLLLVPNS